MEKKFLWIQYFNVAVKRDGGCFISVYYNTQCSVLNENNGIRTFSSFQIDVAGMMYFWGLTIDIVSCIGLELAAGLCVDYAAHISHTFLTCTGTRQERALKTVVDMGPAILSGGTATLLSLAVLANSESYIFVSFFKVSNIHSKKGH